MVGSFTSGFIPRWALNRCGTTVPGALWIGWYRLPFVQQITITNLEKCFYFHGFQRVSELFQLMKPYSHPDAELWIWGDALSSIGKIPSKGRSHSFVYRHSASTWIIGFYSYIVIVHWVCLENLSVWQLPVLMKGREGNSELALKKPVRCGLSHFSYPGTEIVSLNFGCFFEKWLIELPVSTFAQW